MPEVQAVGELADPDQGWPLERSLQQAGGEGTQEDKDGGGRAHGEEKGVGHEVSDLPGGREVGQDPDSRPAAQHRRRGQATLRRTVEE